MPANITKNIIRIGIEKGQYPRYLYKYFRWNENTQSSLREKYLWFSEFSDFNDPFDGMANIKKNYTVAEVNKWLNAQHTPLRINKATLPSVIESMEHAINEAKRETRVCCFTNRNDNLLMWAHYADQHRGICVKFNVEKLDLMWKFLLPVIYKEEYPVCDYLANSGETIQQMLRTKSIDWKYEEEWRSILHCGNNKVIFADDAIEEVIMGYRFDEKEEPLLRLILPSSVSFRHAKLSSSCYKLIIE